MLLLVTLLDEKLRPNIRILLETIVIVFRILLLLASVRMSLACLDETQAKEVQITTGSMQRMSLLGASKIMAIHHSCTT